MFQRSYNATPREDDNFKIGVPAINIMDEGIDSIWWGWMSHTSPWGLRTTLWAQKEPQNDTQDLLRYRWEGPSDSHVSEGPERWERLPPTETKNNKGKAMSIV
jgi:hypothetical protein